MTLFWSENGESDFGQYGCSSLLWKMNAFYSNGLSIPKEAEHVKTVEKSSTPRSTFYLCLSVQVNPINPLGGIWPSS